MRHVGATRINAGLSRDFVSSLNQKAPLLLSRTSGALTAQQTLVARTTARAKAWVLWEPPPARQCEWRLRATCAVAVCATLTAVLFAWLRRGGGGGGGGAADDRGDALVSVALDTAGDGGDATEATTVMVQEGVDAPAVPVLVAGPAVKAPAAPGAPVGEPLRVVGPDGTRQFACRYCSYMSPRSWNLKAHERIHTGERPFGCRYCDYTYVRACERGSRVCCAPSVVDVPRCVLSQPAHTFRC